MFSDFLMKSKKTKTTKSKKTTKKSKKSLDPVDDSGIVLIDDDLEVDSEKELEERKAYLEESRSQDSGD
jgi:hypoxanthine-guanine phosphoribosyltransferase